jgi:uncharacterized protein YuzE
MDEPTQSFWWQYDAEADVLYIHFTTLPSSNHSEMLEEGVIFDYQDKELVGLTILEASKR